MEGVERMVCVGNCVGMLRLQIGSLFECFRLLKLPKANLLFCNFKINWKILHKDHFSGRMSCLKGPQIKDTVPLFSLNCFLSIISPLSMQMTMTIHVVSGAHYQAPESVANIIVITCNKK